MAAPVFPRIAAGLLLAVAYAPLRGQRPAWTRPHDVRVRRGGTWDFRYANLFSFGGGTLRPACRSVKTSASTWEGEGQKVSGRAARAGERTARPAGRVSSTRACTRYHESPQHLVGARSSSSAESRTPRAGFTRPILRSEVPARRELHEARLDDRQRQPPRGSECRILERHRIRVERVVEVDVQIDASTSNVDDLRESQIDLVQPVAVHRTRLDQINGRLVQGEWTAQCRTGRPVGIVEDVGRHDLRTRDALQRSADSNPIPRQRVRRERLVLRQERRLLMAESRRRPRTEGGNGRGGARGRRDVQQFEHVVDELAGWRRA